MAAIVLLGLAGLRTANLRDAVLDASVQASLSAATSAINDGRTADAYRSLELIPVEQRDVAWELAAGDLQQSTLLRTERGVGNTEGALMDSDGTVWVWSHGAVYRITNGSIQKMLNPGLSYGHARHEVRGLLASGSYEGLIVHTDAGEVVFQDTNRGGPWWALDFHPDGRRVVGVNDWGTVECFDLDQGKRVWSTKVSDTASRDVQYAPDGSHIIAACDDGRVIELDEAGNIQFERQTHDRPIRGVTYSPDGKRYATASSDASCALWNRSDGKPIGRYWADSAQWDVEWMQPGILATSSTTGTIRILNEKGMRLQTNLHGHTSTVWRVGISPDGRSLVTGSIHNDLRLWPNVVPVEAARDTVLHSRDGRWRIFQEASGSHRLMDQEGRRSSDLGGDALA
ncbi:MAG: PQQ-binding-like beta-propeller repeat protein, partial [Planctomycetota bacterium]|nr:PQQ-binding-like beta-propeller repeat protein [Planctomycetota bacterium]